MTQQKVFDKFYSAMIVMIAIMFPIITVVGLIAFLVFVVGYKLEWWDRYDIAMKLLEIELGGGEGWTVK